MPDSLVLAPTADPHVFLSPNGERLSPPDGWACLPPGDAAITRKVKLAGPSWAVLEKKGRKVFSKGLWAPHANIERARAEVASQRETPEYARTRAQATARRERDEAGYVVEFGEAVLAFLRFSKEWHPLALELARRVAAHATPVGSGTVARTKRIPVEERAEAAVIAWMRHQTTAYDSLQIARIKGERRAVRRALAEVSRAVLDLHRRDAPHAITQCPLCRAIAPDDDDPDLT
ncbi:MAG: DUF2293 domain-containing protein [Labilithrix sp.]|nr:DUF2293 domain-containing protein [Labilithrix sp.]MCW5812342.1 DUF2293 domain-containing protein [Labilithrix sp.]